MAYTHEIEWQFSGTPLQLQAGVNTLVDRGTAFFISSSLKNDGRLRIDFKVGEPLCQGWAFAQLRPMGTIISLQAEKEYQWSSLEPIWAIIVAELRRQGWKIEEWNPDTANQQPKHAAASQQSGGINFGPINSAGDVNINLSHVSGHDQNTTTTSTTSTQQTSSAAANQSNTIPSSITPAKFNELLREQFNESELKDVCLVLKIDYESLAGNSKADKTRELILYLQRRGRVPELLILVKQERPNTHWPDTFGD